MTLTSHRLVRFFEFSFNAVPFCDRGPLLILREEQECPKQQKTWRDRFSARQCVCVCVRACVRACIRVCAHACVRARACVRACVAILNRAPARACASSRLHSQPLHRPRNCRVCAAVDSLNRGACNSAACVNSLVCSMVTAQNHEDAPCVVAAHSRRVSPGAAGLVDDCRAHAMSGACPCRP